MMILLRTKTGGAVTEHFDTSTVPDDAAYWDALTVRVSRAIVHRRGVARWLTTGLGPWVAAASIACAASLALGALRMTRSTGVATQDQLALRLLPADRLGQRFVIAAAPPLIGTLTTGDPIAGAPR